MSEPQQLPRPLPPWRVIELGGTAAQYCGRLLADLGCSVIKVEPPAGDPGRQAPPFAPRAPDPEGSLSFAYHNAGKRSVVIDLGSDEGRRSLRRLILSADAVLDSLDPDESRGLGLAPEDLRQENPGLVWTSVTPFGRSGPYSDFKATDLTAFAMGGIMNVSGKPGRQPLCAPYQQGYQLACVQAAFGTLLGLWQRHSSGMGQTIEVAIIEVLASEPVLNQIARYSVAATISPRTGGQMGTSPGRLYPCKDGYVFLEALDPHNWRAFWDWMGRPDLLAGEIWEDRFFRLANIDLIDPLVEAMCRDKTREELYREGQARHLPEATVRKPEEYLAAEHTQARQSFVELDHPALGRLSYALPPFRFSACSCGPAAGPPALGQDTAPILGELDSARIAPQEVPESAGISPSLPSRTQDPGARSQDSLPLAGVRVLAFTTQVAGPTLARILADFGADVTTVETARRPRWPASVGDLDPRTRTERTLMFQENHRNQRSVTLDLSSEEGRALARQLVQVSDVVMENFSLGVLERWGLDYGSLRRARPDLIVVSMQGMGRTGPDRSHTAAGYTLMALTGMTYLWSYADSPEPAGTRVAYPDFLGAAQGAVAVMAALHHRWRTGQGQHIDLAQLEAVASVLGPAYLEEAATGTAPRPLGNSSRQWSPHGCYPCLGQDRWCVIAVTSEEEWHSLCEVTCHPRWIEDTRFATNEARLTNREVLDSLIGEWTQQYTPHQVMYILQRAGVPAAPVMNSEDLFLDPHLRQRGFIVETAHDEVGTVAHAAPAMLLNGVRPPIRSTYPAMGRDNDWTFGDLLGLELERLGPGAG